MFDFIVDLVTLPVKVCTAVLDEVIDSDMSGTVEDIKDTIKWR